MTTNTTTSYTQPEPEDCPICLEALTVSEQIVYPLPCQNCTFNYCSRCVEGFCKAAQDDFQVASDGSRQVKVSVTCPQCRTKYPMEISDILLLRQAHTLGTSMIRNGEILGDSDLTATQLSWKRDFTSNGKREQLQEIHAVYAHYMKGKGKLDEESIQKEADVWKAFLKKLPLEEETEDAAGENEGSSRKGEAIVKKHSPRNRKMTVDETLFHGLEECMHNDEKLFLTDLLTSGDVRCLAQAAMILHGVLRLSMSGKGAAIAKQNEVPMSKYEVQKHVDFIARTKLSFPLPNHMPGYFLITSYSKNDGFMTLADQEWDGSMAPPQRSKRIFDNVYGPYYRPPPDEYPCTVVAVQGVRGPIGRLGLRRGDVITHVNDVEWKGTALDLQEYIYECYSHHPQEEISLTVNSNLATATFLKLRQEMLQRSRQPLRNI